MPVLLATLTSRRDQLRDVVAEYKNVVHQYTGHPFLQGPLDQLDAAVLAVFRSWDGDRPSSTAARRESPTTSARPST